MYGCLVGESSAADELEALARACSPRVMRRGEAVVFDARGLSRLFGSPAEMAREVVRLAETRGLTIRFALAGRVTAAELLARHRPGVTIVAPGGAAAAAALADLPLVVLGTDAGLLDTLARWGLGTLGALARLPRADVHARLGPPGVRLHQAACGEDAVPFRPDDAPRRFVERMALDWPVEGLEPLAFVVGRLCEALSGDLERADRGAVAVTTRLNLVTRERHERTLRLPAPMRDARVLRTLILLDLESHPPGAGIDVVEVALDVVPGRIVQSSLLARAAPASETLATLVARLAALMGESRVGAPALVETHDDRVVAMRPLADASLKPGRTPVAPPDSREPALGFRRFRLPRAVQVIVRQGTPIHVRFFARGLEGGDVVSAAGPWRSSGGWWALDGSAWDRDVWDVEVARGGVYRLARDRATGRWEVEGVAD